MNTHEESVSVTEQRLSTEDIRAIAELAKLDLSQDELNRYTNQLSQILNYFTLLQEVDTSAVDPTASIIPLRSVMRDDTVVAALTPQQATQNAPDSEAYQFKVDAVLGGE